MTELATGRHAGPFVPDHLARVWSKFKSLSTSVRFAMVATAVIGIGMSILAFWVNSRVEKGVVQHSAGALALYMEGFMDPFKTELAATGKLSAQSMGRLDATLQQVSASKRVVGAKIWSREGEVIYSSWPQLRGRRFPVTDELRSAFLGEIVAELDHLDAEENEVERALNKSMLEVYVPIRNPAGSEVVVVAEVYELADDLVGSITWARIESAAVFGFLGLAMVGSLSGFVARASRTISSQQEALSVRVRELSELLARNHALQRRVVDANRRSAETNEQVLNRVSAELHDGPAQLVSLSLLRLDEVVSDLAPGSSAAESGEAFRHSLKDALKEIRNICAGLALPELQDTSIAETIGMAVANHERRTRTRVELELADNLPEQTPIDITICVYRFVQESLNNAFRHAGGAGQRVAAEVSSKGLLVTTSDTGPGFDPERRTRNSGKLGLALMRNRIEVLGGEMTIESAPGTGTTLALRFLHSKFE